MRGDELRDILVEGEGADAQRIAVHALRFERIQCPDIAAEVEL